MRPNRPTAMGSYSNGRDVVLLGRLDLQTLLHIAYHSDFLDAVWIKGCSDWRFAWDGVEIGGRDEVWAYARYPYAE